jgi:hypothetical protein
MNVLGYRKLLVVFFLAGIAATITLSPEQADVLKTIATLYLGSNAAIHIGRAVQDGLKDKNNGKSRIHRVTAVSDTEQADRVTPNSH